MGTRGRRPDVGPADGARRPRPWLVPLLVGLLAGSVYALLPRQWTDWDGLALLDRIHYLEHPDPAHPAYAPLIALAARLLGPLGLDELQAARLASALFGAFAVAMLAAVGLARGAGAGRAVLAALLLAAAPSFWQHATTVEVYAPALAFLVAGGLLLERGSPAERPLRNSRLVLAAAAMLAAASFHAGCLLALAGGLVALGRRRRISWARLLLALLLVGGTAAAGVAAAWALSERCARFFSYAATYLPAWDEAGLAATLGAHLHRCWLFFTENEPILAAGAVLGSVGLLAGARPRRRRLGWGWLAAPFLLAYLLLGVPLLGLLMPVLPAAAVIAGSGAAAADSRWPRLRPGTAALALLLVLQVAGAAPARWHEATTPDPRRLQARQLAALLPEDARLVAGDLAWHLRRYTGCKVISVIEIARHARAAGRGILPALHERLASSGRPAFITASGSRRLFQMVHTGHHSPEAAYKALVGLLADPDHPLISDPSQDLRLDRLRIPPTRSPPRDGDRRRRR